MRDGLPRMASVFAAMQLRFTAASLYNTRRAGDCHVHTLDEGRVRK